MKLNLSLLGCGSAFSDGETGEVGEISNGAGLSAKSAGERTVRLVRNSGRPTAGLSASHHFSPSVGETQTQQWQGLTRLTNLTSQTNSASGNHSKIGVVGALATNDCEGAKPFPHASPARAREGPPAVFVLAFDLDGKGVTCRDPVSATMA